MTEPAVASHLDRDTALTPVGNGVFTIVPTDEWNAPAGPNGGYVAAILARALVEAVDDAARPLRSFTAQFLRPPVTGEELRVTATVERVGRTVTNLSVRAEQRDKLVAMGIAIAATEQISALDYDTPAPDFPPPETIASLPRFDGLPTIASRYIFKPCLGPGLYSGGDEALSGGWIRLDDPRPFDAIAAVAYLDAWLPAPFTRLTGPVAAPTLDYTVHLRGTLPPPGLDPDAYLMMRTASTTSAQGFFEEDCEIWSPDGVLLAQSRQLALIIPLAELRR
jgi:acyl-CoA thioesterase